MRMIKIHNNYGSDNIKLMEDLQQDLDILKRDYSEFRCAKKWRTFRYSMSSNDSLNLPDIYIKIYRNSISSIDWYYLPDLYKRQEIKRSPIFLSEAQKFWLSINPANLRSISKQVYLSVILVLYKQYPEAQDDPLTTSQSIVQDSKIDFMDHQNLTFAEFYDVLFEIIDNLCKSSLSGEYSRILFLSKVNLLNSPEFNTLNLYSKLHLGEPPRLSFYPWMQKTNRFLTPEKVMKLPKIFKAPSVSSLAPKFINRSKQKTFRDSVPIKWDLQKIIENRKKSSLRSITPVLVKTKNSQSQKKIETKKQPLSISPVKDRKANFMLEEIIEERNKNPFKKLFDI